MRSVGIVRKIDELGRIVFPMELRKKLSIQIGDPMEIFVDGNLILLKKYEPACIFCGEAGNLTVYKNKNICESCRDKLSESESNPESATESE